MLIDLHAHTSGISTCCIAAYPEILQKAKDVGLDGIVLTNHYKSAYLKGGTPAALAARYIAEYENAKALGKEMGLRVFFGFEVRMEQHNDVELLVYGVEPDFLTRHPEVYNYSQKKLYELVHAEGGFVVQPHPMRNGKNVLMDLAYLDGIELNMHFMYDGPHKEELIPLALANGKFLTVGGDYHADKPRRPRCGVFLPEDLSNTRQIMEYLQNERSPRFLIHEDIEGDPEELIVNR